MGERNIVVENTGANPVIGYSFMLRVEGVYDLPCRAVKGFQKENEFEYIQEGGMNDYVHIKRKPISKPFTFQVERYVGVDLIDPLPLGSEPILPIILFVNACAFPKLKPVRTYTFTGCTVIAKDYGNLDAEKSGLVVETTTIAYREMVCVAVPTQALDLGETGMEHKRPHKDGEPEETGYAERPKNEKDASNRRGAMIEAAKANTWSKKTHAVVTKTTEADSLAKKKEAAKANSWSKKSHAAVPETQDTASLAEKKKAAKENSWSKKAHAVVPKTTAADSLAKKKEAATASTWSKKTHAAVPKTKDTASLAEKKKTATANTWSKKTHAAVPKTTAADSLATKKETATANTWSKKSYAVVPKAPDKPKPAVNQTYVKELLERIRKKNQKEPAFAKQPVEDTSLAKMIEFSSKKVWPNESHAMTLQEK